LLEWYAWKAWRTIQNGRKRNPFRLIPRENFCPLYPPLYPPSGSLGRRSGAGSGLGRLCLWGQCRVSPPVTPVKNGVFSTGGSRETQGVGTAGGNPAEEDAATCQSRSTPSPDPGGTGRHDGVRKVEELSVGGRRRQNPLHATGLDGGLPRAKSAQSGGATWKSCSW